MITEDRGITVTEEIITAVPGGIIIIIPETVHVREIITIIIQMTGTPEEIPEAAIMTGKIIIMKIIW